MTVQLKLSAIRKAINEIVSVGSNQGSASLVDVLKLNTRGMVIDQDNGTITIKFKPNGQPEQKKTPTVKAIAPSSEVSGLEFVRGEKKALRVQYKESITDEDGIKNNMFGKVISVREVEVMIVGFENGKFRLRKENGRIVNGTKKAVLAALSGDTSSPKIKERKPLKKKQASDGTKQSTESGAKLVKTKVTGVNPYSNSKKAELEKKFKVQAKKLSTKGLSPKLFWKPIQIDDRVYRIIAASASKERVRLLNVKSGKTAVMEVSDVFPLSN